MEVRKLNKRSIFLKDKIAGDTKTMRDRIITPIPFLSFTLAKKITKTWPRLKFVMLMWLKKNETSRTEWAKVVIVWRWPKKALIWSLILDNRTWNAINSMNSMKSSFAPKMSRNFGRKKESTNSVKNMLLSSTNLLRGTWIS